jgi:hypothetical protein
MGIGMGSPKMPASEEIGEFGEVWVEEMRKGRDC